KRFAKCRRLPELRPGANLLSNRKIPYEKQGRPPLPHQRGSVQWNLLDAVAPEPEVETRAGHVAPDARGTRSAKAGRRRAQARTDRATGSLVSRSGAARR